MARRMGSERESLEDAEERLIAGAVQMYLMSDSPDYESFEQYVHRVFFDPDFAERHRATWTYA